MASIKSLKTRIKSIGSTKKITKAMKLISISRLKQSNLKRDSAKSYIINFEDILNTVIKDNAQNFSHMVHKVFTSNEQANHSDPLFKASQFNNCNVYIIITSDKGLCGNFNSSVIKKINQLISENKQDNKEILCFTIGKKGYENLKKRSDIKLQNIISEIINVKSFNFSVAENISNEIIHVMKNSTHNLNNISLVYNDFISTLKFNTAELKILPLDLNLVQNTTQDSTQYLYEPKAKNLMDYLAQNYLSVMLYKVILSSMLSEYSTRMTAMDNATRNSDELLKKLNREYNKTRQAKITEELTEIISGMQAIES